MFSNTPRTQQEVLHSISHSAFRVWNILMGIGYTNEWWSWIIRIIYTFLKLHLPECIQSKQGLAPPHPNTHHSSKFSDPPTDPRLLPGTCFTLFSWLQTPTTSFNHLCDFFQKPQILSSFLVNKQLLMEAADNKCFKEIRITKKLIHHNETLCVFLSICDCCEVKSVYFDIPIFWVRTSCR
jgi:hypothetical protein